MLPANLRCATISDIVVAPATHGGASAADGLDW